jgi:penicillin-insensitive murein endopeptidase
VHQTWPIGRKVIARLKSSPGRWQSSRDRAPIETTFNELRLAFAIIVPLSGAMKARLVLIPLLVFVIGNAVPVSAQDKGSVDPQPLPPLTNPKDPKLPAKELFARKLLPAAMPTEMIGTYNKGCIAGAKEMPITGDTWQVMRLSRNRNWGSPEIIALLKRLSVKAHQDAGWPGLLIGDIGQPRGGPALSGHASHQIGLDADVWLTPMPDHLLSREEREDMSATMMVRNDRLDIDPKAWTSEHWKVLRDAAQEPSVQRIFVNAAIKKALCREAKGDRSWLTKIRPWYGHDYHFHIRMRCPPGAKECHGQPDQTGGDGCSKRDLAYWFKESILHPKPPKQPEKPARGITLAQLPAACRAVLNAPGAKQH